MLAGIDEGEDFGNRRIRHSERARRIQPFGKDPGRFKQLLIERPDRGEPLTRKLAAFHADNVEAFETRILTVYKAIRNDVAANAADATDHGLLTNACELMHGRQAADENKIADLTMSAERRRGCENDVVADLAIVTHVAAIHEVAAVADAGSAAAADCAGAHRDRLPDRATVADLKFRRFTAIAQRLRRAPEGSERIDGTAGADRRVPHHMDMGNQLAVSADPDIAADHAIWADRRALADHSAVFNPRGRVDRGHRGVRVSRQR